MDELKQAPTIEKFLRDEGLRAHPSSVMDPHADSITTALAHGASLEVIRRWLQKQGIEVARQSIHEFIVRRGLRRLRTPAPRLLIPLEVAEVPALPPQPEAVVEPRENAGKEARREKLALKRIPPSLPPAAPSPKPPADIERKRALNLLNEAAKQSENRYKTD